MPIYSFPNGKTRINILSVHIPKTGGTSIGQFFKSVGFSEHFGVEHQVIRPQMICPPQHYDYDILTRLFNLDLFHYSFAIVRHPIKRMISDYKWAMTKSTLPDKNMRFSDWFELSISLYNKNQYFLANHIKPQAFFVGPKIKRIFNYEDGLDNIMSMVFSDLGLVSSKPFLIPNVNVSSALSVDISKADAAEIRKFYAKDFELFGYD